MASAVQSLLTTLKRILNTLLPFTDPNTPLAQDIAHSLALIAVLYFAPMILERRVERAIRDQVPPQEELINREPAIDHNLANNGGAEGVREDPAVPALQATNELPPNDFAQTDAAQDAFPPPFLQDGDPGPANRQPQPRPRDPARPLTTKKAASLARKDRRRAYNEFLRSQGEAQRAAAAEGAEEREAVLEAERQRRKEVEREIEERNRREREKARDLERKEKEAEEKDTERALGMVSGALEGEGKGKRWFGQDKSRGMCDLAAVAKKIKRKTEWVEKVVRSSGVLGTRHVDGEKELMLITGKGWVVRIRESDMRVAWERAVTADVGSEGIVRMADLGALLEGVLREGVAAH